MNDRRRNTFRIDYDKLAEAIVKAQNESEKHTYSGDVLSFLASPIMGVFSALGLLFAVAAIVTAVKQWNTLVNSFSTGFLVVMLTIMFVLVGGVFAYISFRASRELRKTDDYKMLATILSSLTSFIAMVVALVALIITIKR
ncbi:MAG: hypothetical protein IKF58_09210 [Bacillus sp. (in: Bacteria)]|nr:hypothetical protein [Bacillus sp. (in: firmicutes)]